MGRILWQYLSKKIRIEYEFWCFWCL